MKMGSIASRQPNSEHIYFDFKPTPSFYYELRIKPEDFLKWLCHQIELDEYDPAVKNVWLRSQDIGIDSQPSKAQRFWDAQKFA